MRRIFSYGSKAGALLGNAEDYGAAYGAAGGTIGTAAGALSALLFAGFVLVVYLRVFKKTLRKERKTSADSYGEIFKLLIITIIPVLVSSTIYNCNATIDQAVYKNIAAWQGYSKTDYGTWNGIYTGKYQVLINVPLAIASSLAASSVPALSAAYASGNEARRNGRSGLPHALSWSWHSRVQSEWACLPPRFFRCCLVIPPSLRQECCRPVPWPSFSSPCRPFPTVCCGMNRMKEPIKNAVIALALHLIILVALMLGLDLNIFAVIIANACFGLIMCILNARSIRRYSGYRQEVRRTFSCRRFQRLEWAWYGLFTVCSSICFGAI